MKYGVRKVVGGMAPHVNEDSYVAYAIERTMIEHEQLRTLIARFMPLRHTPLRSIEFGCGWGRLLKALPSPIGVERDEQLRNIGIGFGRRILTWEESFPNVDIGLTFTFLQHLNSAELGIIAARIRSHVRDLLILCEQTTGDYHDCHGRTPEEYAAIFPEFELIHTEERKIEPGWHADSHYMIWKRRITNE